MKTNTNQQEVKKTNKHNSHLDNNIFAAQQDKCALWKGCVLRCAALPPAGVEDRCEEGGKKVGRKYF